MPKSNRPDQNGTHRVAYKRNKKIIFATQTICGICGQPVDFGMKYPHPLSPSVDHIIPVNKGGHPSDIDNLQLAHLKCNRDKWDKTPDEIAAEERKDNEKTGMLADGNGLPWTMDWTKYKGG